MNMKKQKNGFTLIIVVILIALISSALIVWGGQSHTMIQTTQMQTIQAHLDDAINSAAQWAGVNSSKLKKKPITIDLSELQIHGLHCECRIIKQSFGRKTIEITAVAGEGIRQARKTIQIEL